MLNPNPKIIVKYLRGRLVEQEHAGFVIVADKKHIIDSSGDTSNYPFYIRSCAKPLQASLIVDTGMYEYYNMAKAEIALCCASHAGERVHTDIAKSLLKKIGINEDNLKCGLHEPLSKTRMKEMLLSDEKVNVLQNNCSGKHLMMLGLCKMNHWDIDTYYEPEHPLQIMIKEKVSELCEIKHNYPLTTDGCGVPIMSMPLFNLAKGYLNLFTDKKYELIKDAILENPYILGGENRLDTKIMENSRNLIAKVGAGGLCVVVNLEREEALVVKISDSDMKAREVAVIKSLKNLHWADIEVDTEIKTIHGQVVGEIVFC